MNLSTSTYTMPPGKKQKTTEDENAVFTPHQYAMTDDPVPPEFETELATDQAGSSFTVPSESEHHSQETVVMTVENQREEVNVS
jgi:hypothetical protein